MHRLRRPTTSLTTRLTVTQKLLSTKSQTTQRKTNSRDGNRVSHAHLRRQTTSLTTRLTVTQKLLSTKSQTAQ
jgi:hypothetical protein